MIQMEEMTLQAWLKKVKASLSDMKEQVLISWTEKIAPISLIDLLKRTERSEEDRLFWANNERDFMLLGLGTTEVMVAEEDRYEELDKQWKQLVEEAYIYNPYMEEGTGLTALGGMTFDPLHEGSELWRLYPTSQLTLPRYLVSFTNGAYYFTVNRYVKKDENLSTVVEEIEDQLQSLQKEDETFEPLRQRIVKRLEKDPEAWKASVQRAVDTIRAQEAEKIVLARELRLTFQDRVQISLLIERLMDSQSQAYVFAYEQGDDCFLGASPERLVYVRGDELLSTCLAGTAPRGKNTKEDEEIAKEQLMENSKNREEHDHVVQMIKGSIAPFTEKTHIPDTPVVLTLRNLQHLYTPVRARLKAGVSVFQLIEVLHPTPALGGVPRDKALAFIREEEQFDRGWYGAPIGWIDYQGNSEFAVAIRSGLVQGNEMSLFAGCGVMADSDPEEEYKETAVKFLPLLTILED